MYKSNQNINFLQSAEWRKFQELVGHKTFFIEKEDFFASIIEHELPIVGKYIYAPRGPLVGISNFKFKILNKTQDSKDKIKNGMQELIELAKRENAGWIRIDPESEDILKAIKKSVDYKIAKAPHDMQPKEIFVIDITKPEEQLLSEMKSKTRYNIKLSQKNVKVATSDKGQETKNEYIENFWKLTREMSARQGIATHSGGYYRKMFESLPEEMLKLYVAEYDGKIIAANLMLFYGDTAIYLHGASSNDYRNVMAPYLLQWQAILDAKKAGYAKYDFGGIKTLNVQTSKRQTSNDWAGITKFKLGFSPDMQPIVFPGSYDIVVNPWKYDLYRILQKAKELFVKIRK